jgi:hypothetical protein
MDNVMLQQVQEKVLTVCGQSVLLDSDVATLYGIETKRVNEAVKNNPEKFPAGYVFSVDAGEVQDLRSRFSTANLVPHPHLPKRHTPPETFPGCFLPPHSLAWFQCHRVKPRHYPAAHSARKQSTPFPVLVVTLHNP